jgi:site-specific DNA-methyltransferase (adenine-specific)
MPIINVRVSKKQIEPFTPSRTGAEGAVRIAPPLRFALNDDGTIAPGSTLPGTTGEAEADLPRLITHDPAHGLWLYQANCFELLDAIAAKYPEGRFDAVFADPPYFLSNGGITCHAGRMVKVDKADWDKSRGPELNHQFNLEWLSRCQRVLKPNGTIWVTGTQHVIFSVGYAMQQLGFKLLNDIAWEKPNPPPNLSCRYFTHSTETVLWAAKNEKSKHRFNYKLMRELNRGKQMKSVWTLAAPASAEKKFGKHPTQKPLVLVERCLLASTETGDLVLDPFVGAGTTLVAAARLARCCVGVDLSLRWMQVAAERVRDTLQQLRSQTPELVLNEPDARN